MINKKIYKRILLITTSILIAMSNIIEAKAGDGEGAYFGGADQNTGTGSGSGGQSVATMETEEGQSKRIATCEWSIKSTGYSWVYIDAYDNLGNKIPNIKYFDEPILAGTYIELNVYETKGYTKTAYYKVTTVKETTSCYNIQIPCSGQSTSRTSYKEKIKSSNVLPIVKVLPPDVETGTQTCTTNICNTVSETVEPNGEEISWCKSKVGLTHSELSSSYSVLYKDSNDISTNNSSNSKYNTTFVHTGTSQCTSSGPTYSGSTVTLSKNCTFYYNREKTCINVKNGKVRYILNDEQCEQDEYELKLENGRWKYFIPLNTKSEQGFSFIMSSSGNKQTSGICTNIISNYSDFRNLITDSNGNEFDTKINEEQAKERVKNGCYYKSTIKIPISQEFYHEDNDNKFKGFNFYYKPIDITNPFPNGIGASSIWYEWSTQGKTNPNIANSYNSITYIAQNINATTVRDYTKNNPYTSWNNMNLNGTSKFIETENIVTRLVDRNSFYKLGCGPSNADWSECRQ